MHTTLQISADLNRAIMVRSHHKRSKPRSKAPQYVPRREAIYGTKSYRDALQRAFNNAKKQIYFNPDMTNFITLTYAGKTHTVDDVLNDIKQLIKKEVRSTPAKRGHLKYLYIMEYQKRGSIHVHMIANNQFTLQVNKNGYNELTYWKKGYSSVLTIQDFDSNFRPYLYLFKYMKKSQRIGRSFVHTSKNLNNYTDLKESEINLEHWRTINMELTQTTVETTTFTFYKNYLQFDDTINPQLINHPKGELAQWHEQVKLHSNKELEKILANHSRR